MIQPMTNLVMMMMRRVNLFWFVGDEDADENDDNGDEDDEDFECQ